MIEEQTHSFNKKGWLGLTGKNQEIGNIISRLILKSLPQSIKKSVDDETLVDALAYEVLRLCLSYQRHEYSKVETIHLSKSIKSIFQNEELLGQLLQILELAGISDERNILHFFSDKAFWRGPIRLRKEIYGKHINFPEKSSGFIPNYILPADIRSPLFFFRWSTILTQSNLRLSRFKSLLLYDQFRESITKEFNGINLHSALPRFYAAKSGLGNREQDISHAIKETEKVISQLPTSWALAFMHGDYADLIQWKNISGSEFMPDFILTGLGPFLLDLYANTKNKAGDVDPSNKWAARTKFIKRHKSRRDQILIRRRQQPVRKRKSLKTGREVIAGYSYNTIFNCELLTEDFLSIPYLDGDLLWGYKGSGAELIKGYRKKS